MNNTNLGMSIGQLAKLAKVTSRTLRYYEELGLIVPKTRGENRYRYYDESHLLRLGTIRLLRELGFGLKDIVAALAPVLDPQGHVTLTGQDMSRRISEALHKQKLQLLQKQAEIQQALQGINSTLQGLSTCGSCEDSTRLSDCGDCSRGPVEVVNMSQRYNNDASPRNGLDKSEALRKTKGLRNL